MSANSMPSLGAGDLAAGERLCAQGRDELAQALELGVDTERHGALGAPVGAHEAEAVVGAEGHGAQLPRPPALRVEDERDALGRAGGEMQRERPRRRVGVEPGRDRDDEVEPLDRRARRAHLQHRLEAVALDDAVRRERERDVDGRLAAQRERDRDEDGERRAEHGEVGAPEREREQQRARREPRVDRQPGRDAGGHGGGAAAR